MLDDDPDAALDEAINALAFTRHPYGLPVAGLRSDIERLSLVDLKAFYDSYYTPGNAILAVVGDVRPEDVTSFIAGAFGAIEAAAVPPPAPRPEPPQVAPRHTEVVGDDRAARAVVAFRTPEATHPDSAALEVLAHVLAGGRSSRLQRGLVRGRRLAAEASAERVLTAEPGLYTVSALLRIGAELEPSHRAMIAVLDDLRASGVGDEEIEKAKSLLRLEYLASTETSLGLAGSLAFWESLGGWALGPEFEARVSEIAAPEIARVLELYFRLEAVNSAWRLARTS